MDAKRTLDAIASGAGLLLLSPVMGGVACAIWWHDRGTPIYSARRCGVGGAEFTMYKFRTMVLNADKLGASSTGNGDPRITPVGRFMRATKIDELPQLINVVRGDMSLVGPRPNIGWEVASYSEEERGLLAVRPGITDLASIVFADEGAILADHADPDLAYEQLIRPWKSRLGLVYARNASVPLNLRIIALTLLNSVSRPRALSQIGRLLRSLGADVALLRIATREYPLTPSAPPGHQGTITAVPAA